MLFNRALTFSFLSIFFSIVLLGCSSTETDFRTNPEISLPQKNGLINMMADDNTNVDSVAITNQHDTIDIIVVQCANGYGYALHNYDFNPLIETELNRFKYINVKPFPLKTLMGTAYQGVFDKKYCPPIIAKVQVDFLILTRFDHPYGKLDEKEDSWGYELKIVNTKTLQQINSISAHDLKEYKDLETHIKNNMSTLKSDIGKLK